MEKKTNFFEKFANAATHFTGSSYAFIAAACIIVIWAACGPLFNYSETWQLIINTGTTIITFLMVFLIQKAQNKDSKAIQIKLNELIASSTRASNRLVDIEDLSEDELDAIHKFYAQLAELAKRDEETKLESSHSKDAALETHILKASKTTERKEKRNERSNGSH
jgi:low affinity Fe/Cu permease